MIRKALLLAAVTVLGACADPAERIAAPRTASQDGSGVLDCPDPRQNGSGQLYCP